MPNAIFIKNNLETADGFKARASSSGIMDFLQVSREEKLSLFTIYQIKGDRIYDKLRQAYEALKESNIIDIT